MATETLWKHREEQSMLFGVPAVVQCQQETAPDGEPLALSIIATWYPRTEPEALAIQLLLKNAKQGIVQWVKGLE